MTQNPPTPPSLNGIDSKVSALEARVSELERRVSMNNSATQIWWQRISGCLNDYPEFETAIELGRAARRDNSPS